MSFAACAEQAAAPTATVTAPAGTVTVTPPAAATTPARTTTAPAVTVTATPPPAQAKEPTYTVMDPRAYMAPIPFVGLSPRLDTLVGKKIGVVNLMGGNEAALETVAAALMKAVPGCNAEYLQMRDTKGAAELAWIKTKHGIILGNNY